MFEQFKAEILTRAKAVNACSGQYKRAAESKDFSELILVITDNFTYACNNKVIDAELLEQVKDDAEKCNLFVNVNVTSGFLLASGSATVRASDSATVEASDSATVEAYDSATVEASGSSYINVRSTMDCKIYEKAIMRYRDTNEIIIVKGSHTIKEI